MVPPYMSRWWPRMYPTDIVPLVDISQYPTLIQLKYFLGRIHHCVTVVGKFIFDSNFCFALLLTKDNLDYCCINMNEKKE